MKVCKLKYLQLKAQCPCLGSLFFFFFTQNNLWSFCSSVQWVCSHSEDGITSDAAFSPDDLPSKHRSRAQITSLFLWKMTPIVLLSFLQRVPVDHCWLRAKTFSSLMRTKLLLAYRRKYSSHKHLICWSMQCSILA